MKDIAYQNKDITQKLSAELLKNKSLAVYGLPDIYIKDLLPTNLPAVEANELRMDNLFVLGDDTLALIDYESSFGKKGLGLKNIKKRNKFLNRCILIKKYVKRRKWNEIKGSGINSLYLFGGTWNRQILSWLHRYRYFKINHLWGIRNLVAYRLNYDSNR